MTIIDMRPHGWDGLTPRQWEALRDMIKEVYNMAVLLRNPVLMIRAENFLFDTEGHDG